ncbi:MAG TPA: serine hydrolase domain-containing protein [Terriglobales bacterium]|nr:serine hydrolase domain-containing protein [Terriglobales bacterium]
MIHRAPKLCALWLLLLLLCGTAAAQLSPQVLRQIDDIVNKAMSAQKIPGLSLAIGVQGHVVLKKAYGSADLENGIPLRPDTLMRTGSLCKPLTAVGVLELVEQGKVKLDAPVQEYCSHFPKKEWTVTTRQLLGHIGGVRAYEGKESESTMHYYSLIDGMIMFKNDPLAFEPGTKYLYTTHGYTVLGCVIEGVTGLPYPEYMRRHILKPAGMAHTFVDDVYTIIPGRSHGYWKIDSKVVNDGPMDSSYKIPGGGYLSTPEDMVRFVMKLLDQELLKPETMRLMWTSLKTSDGKETRYGLGWGIGDLDGLPAYGHTGSQQGTSTAMLVIPARKIVSVVMINMRGINAAEINRAIASSVLKSYELKAR